MAATQVVAVWATAPGLACSELRFAFWQMTEIKKAPVVKRVLFFF